MIALVESMALNAKAHVDDDLYEEELWWSISFGKHPSGLVELT